MIPSKSKCLKYLRQVFGPNARFQTKDDGALELWNRTEAGDHPIVSARPADPRESPASLPWVVLRLAFRTLGYGVELFEDRLELVPLCQHGKAGACLECAVPS